MADEANTAFEPVKTRVENHVYEAGKRSECDAALASIHALLRAAYGGIFICRKRGVESAIFFPIAVVGVVIIMVSRPHVLRHPGDHTEDKTERPIEPACTKQAAMATFVHQGKRSHREEADQQDQRDGEPEGNVDSPHREPPKERKRR